MRGVRQCGEQPPVLLLDLSDLSRVSKAAYVKGRGDRRSGLTVRNCDARCAARKGLRRRLSGSSRISGHRSFTMPLISSAT